MEQKDYLKREIEKIGLIIAAIRQKLLGGKACTAVTIERDFEVTKEMLLSSINFDLDQFLNNENESSMAYIQTFSGFNVENLESLALFLMQIAHNIETAKAHKYLEKSMHLFELCNQKDKTYSAERESKVLEIKSALMY